MRSTSRAVSRIADGCGVPCQILDNCIKGKYKPAWKSQVSKQLLSEAEEVLVGWIQYRSETAREGIGASASPPTAVSGKR